MIFEPLGTKPVQRMKALVKSYSKNLTEPRVTTTNKNLYIYTQQQWEIFENQPTFVSYERIV